MNAVKTSRVQTPCALPVQLRTQVGFDSSELMFDHKGKPQYNLLQIKEIANLKKTKSGPGGVSRAPPKGPELPLRVHGHVGGHLPCKVESSPHESVGAWPLSCTSVTAVIGFPRQLWNTWTSFFSMFQSHHFSPYFHLVYPQGLYTDFKVNCS